MSYKNNNQLEDHLETLYEMKEARKAQSVAKKILKEKGRNIDEDDIKCEELPNEETNTLKH